MKKNIIITEEMVREITNHYLTESFYPTNEKVLIIKDYLDKNFKKTILSDIDSNGYPKEVGTVDLLDNRKQSVKTLHGDELLLLLDDKFNNMIKNKEDRLKFFKQIIKDWYSGKLTKNGVLTVNFIK